MTRLVPEVSVENRRRYIPGISTLAFQFATLLLELTLLKYIVYVFIVVVVLYYHPMMQRRSLVNNSTAKGLVKMSAN